MQSQADTSLKAYWWQNRLVIGLAGALISFLVYCLVPGEEYPEAPLMSFIMTLMAMWWVTEVIPIAVTSLLPIILFPLLNISDVDIVGAFYGKPIIFLFLGGFILALGLQESGLHKRIALKIVKWIGSSPKRLILGFMVASGFLSMWISNTASVMVMLPISLSILEGVKKSVDDEKLLKYFGICMMLGIAYAADIGGMATLIGTPPNLIFLEMYSQLVPDAPPIGFVDWMILGLPLSIMFMSIGWFMLTHFIYKFPRKNFFNDKSIIDRQLKELGPMSWDEKWSGLIFLLAAVLWMTGSNIEINDNFTIYGWRTLLNLPYVNDSAIAIGMAVFLFLIPSRQYEDRALLTWKKARKVPWGILLLFGGGFAIAGGFEMSGLSRMIEQLFSNLPDLSPIVIMAIICIFVTFITELTSNSAIANLLLPILAASSIALAIDPKLLMIPATLSASCAFMMPIASPTQAIVFGSGYVTIRQMMRTGIWFNLLGVILIMVLFSIIHQFLWT